MRAALRTIRMWKNNGYTARKRTDSPFLPRQSFGAGERKRYGYTGDRDCCAIGCGGSLLNLYRTFARLRNTYPVLAQGKMVKHPVYNDGNTSQQSIAAWYRELDGERMLVVHNFGREEQILTLTDQPDKAVGVSGEVKLQRGDASSKLLMGAWSSVVFTL